MNSPIEAGREIEWVEVGGRSGYRVKPEHPAMTLAYETVAHIEAETETAASSEEA
jgi:hypothetical protein